VKKDSSRDLESLDEFGADDDNMFYSNAISQVSHTGPGSFFNEMNMG